MALPLIMALHAAVLAGLAFVPPRPSFDAIVFVDLSPIAGGAPKSEIDGAPSPPSDDEAQEPSATDAQAGTSAVSKEAPQAEPETPAAEAPEAEAEPAEAEADGLVASEQSSLSSADVLAMVETITGTDAATVAEPVVTAVSHDRLAEIQAQQARAFASRRGGGCAIDAALKEGLSTDAAVQVALAAIPSADKSVSNALQLWDGDWTSRDGDEMSDPLASVRARTIAVVDAAPAACRNAPVKGPRFVIVPLDQGADIVIVIVIGSGDWRWRDVLPEKAPALFRWLGINR